MIPTCSAHLDQMNAYRDFLRLKSSSILNKFVKSNNKEVLAKAVDVGGVGVIPKTDVFF